MAGGEDLWPNPFRGRCPSPRELAEWLKREGYEGEAGLLPFLLPVRDCERLRRDLEPWFGWKSLRWVYSPRGRPPSNVLDILLDVICRCYRG